MTRILVVEDEFLVADELLQTLQRAGFAVLGPVADVAEALGLAHAAALDGAVLDVRLRGGETYGVADALRARGIPFLLATGWARDALPERFRAAPLLQKPYLPDDLARAVAALFRRP